MTRPVGVMGTTCSLCVTVKNCDLQRGNELLARAEAQLRKCEALTSSWIDSSEISRLNRAKAGETLVLSPFTVEFLKKAKEAFQKTDGAFDATCGPLWFHWKRCEDEGRVPTLEELTQIRAASGWEFLEFSEKTEGEDAFQVTKRSDGVSVVTGGLAKGMAIDSALEILKSDVATLSAFVEVGGDLATFNCSAPIRIDDSSNRQSAGKEQTVEKKQETGKVLGIGKEQETGKDRVTGKEQGNASRTICVPNGGVCTSGHYARFFLIQGKKFSQILNPKTGWPTSRQWTVTTTASTAAEADYWATALEVLGREGVARLPDGVQAEFIEENSDSSEK